MKNKVGCLIVPLVIFLFTFRVAVINDYDLKIETSPRIGTDVRMLSDIDRYPLLLFVNEPYRLIVPAKVKGKLTRVSIKDVEVTGKKVKATYDFKRFAEVVRINDQKVNFFLGNLNLPPDDVEVKLVVLMTVDDEEAEYVIKCKMRHKRTVKLGNYFYDRLMAF